MPIYGNAALGLFTLTTVLVGLRLLWLWRRTHKKPELLLGTALLIGAVGNAMVVASVDRSLLPEETGFLAVRVAASVVNVSFVFFAAFVWRVYRPGSAWARRLLLAGALAILCPQLITLLEPALISPMFWVEFALREAVYVWGAAESFAFHAIMRRRVSYGLGDPVVMNRVFVWGVAMACAVPMLGGIQVGHWFLPTTRLGQTFMTVGWLAAVPATSLVLLTFFPPKAYRDWVRARHSSDEALP